GLREADTGVVHEVADRLHAPARRQRGELSLRPVEPEHREAATDEAAPPPVQEQVDEDEVGLDERALKLEVQAVDERLHLLRDSGRERAAAGPQHEARAARGGLERADEA